MKHRGKKPYLTYALNNEGYLVHIDNVPNGISCACFCPHCKSGLCAKNGGEEKVHHFAHLNETDCVGAVESVLHIMAKEVLQETKSIRLPAISNVCDSALVHFDKIEVEAYDKKLDLRPDCVGYFGDKFIWIEFKRYHAVDQKKKGKIISARIDCVEIDLNGCELERNKVKELLIKQMDKRVWIYNKKNQNFQQINMNNSRNNFDLDYDINTSIDRTIAVDNTGKIIQLSNLEEIDMNTYTYYCIACGKEVCIDVNSDGIYSFIHVDKYTACDDKIYLIETAKAILVDIFHSSDNFEICINQPHICKHNESCYFYDKNACYKNKQHCYELKSLGYNCCEKDVILSDFGLRAHMLISRNNDLKDAIVVNIKSGDCYVDYTTNLRMIEIDIYDEEDLYILKEHALKHYNHCSFNNFKKNQCLYIDRDDIIINILTFTLYSSGKSFVKYKPCKDICISNTISPSIVTELYLDGNVCLETAQMFGLLYCYRNKIKACYCKLCYYIRHYDMYDSICIRYKTKGTPHYPLKEVPINCTCFNLNRGLVEHIENEAQDISIIAELPLNNK